jgi:hypothetical protein
MKQDTRKIPATPRPIQPITAPISQGKIILAVALIAVMGFLWIRMFLRHGKPAAASGKSPVPKAAQAAGAKSTAPPVRLSYAPLTIVPGRQDRLARDLFSVPDKAVFPWQQKVLPVPQAEKPGADTPPEDPWEKLIRPLVERMVVDAIGTDPKGTAQAFIQDRFLSVGDVLPLKQGQTLYELKVKQIHSNAVVLGWQDHEVTLRMSEPGMSGDK